MASTHQNVTNFAQIALLCDAACRPAAFRVVDEAQDSGQLPEVPDLGRARRALLGRGRDVHDGATAAPQLVCTASTTARLAWPPELA